MNIDFSKMGGYYEKEEINPRDIFMSLISKPKEYNYPRDVQAEVWSQWYSNRNSNNILIKMNTGSGKTIVGLIMLQSSLNEGFGPAVYVVPDKYLVKQVIAEAKKIGLAAVDNENDYSFKNSKAILVINIHKLINGKSVFGFRQKGNVNIGTVLIDDLHACIDVIDQQYTINLNYNTDAYNKIIEILGRNSDVKDSHTFHLISDINDSSENYLVPFWVWQEVCEEIKKIIIENADEDIVKFHLPLIDEAWELCSCVVSPRCIEISPKNIPIDNIRSFNDANRHIFMSATISDDNVFVSSLGLTNLDDIKLITPSQANDIGERMFIFPNLLNYEITDDEIREKLIELSKEYNITVIVPSYKIAEKWRTMCAEEQIQILNKDNIEQGIYKIKTKTFSGLTVLVNKYDGIDLPDDCCRFLVLDGIPNLEKEYDLVVQSSDPNNKEFVKASAQKIEQGMGRGVRSNSDYCNIVLMGSQLDNLLVNEEGVQFFSPATKAQYLLSKKIWDQLVAGSSRPNIDVVFSVASYLLDRDEEWVSQSKKTVNGLKYNKTLDINNVVIAFRKAFDQALIQKYDEAFKILQNELSFNSKLDDTTRSFLMQLMAEYKNFNNWSDSQKLLSDALKYNRKIIKPSKDFKYDIELNNTSQEENIIKEISKYKDPNLFMIKIKAITECLFFDHCKDDKSRNEYTKNFEVAIEDLGNFLGFVSSRPENTYKDGGPDNLWAFSDSINFVIECKSGVKEDIDSISKSYTSQLGNSVLWFSKKCETLKSNNINCIPIIIHRTNIFDKQAYPPNNTKVITEEELDRLGESFLNFARDICGDFKDNLYVSNIRLLLNKYCLSADRIINNYTKEPKLQ